MKFKIDENLPVEFAELLIQAQHDAITVAAQGLQGEDDPAVVEASLREGRVLVTLDMDFADIRSYPPSQFPGFVVLRVARHDKHHLLQVFEGVIPLLDREPL